ncbi:penicillin acylase family protein [Desulforhopalus singaporensis]|uniref:Penicillin amidase n=1 Tax=Desulforhopalus singaporensis TaxID=91360 RepID=A0A1H0N4K0_9BACT|nr:penicillin acylase family protein [Desulforhopalus singaporensis]SDO87562.1 penicillin amidase [Desulforhopalus singaporensis]
MKTNKTFILVVVLMLLALSSSAGFFGWLYLKRLLPQIEGSTAVFGIADTVQIIRDRWGVTHINAQSGSDACYALGYAVAQDRLFQIELQRRLARGELAEIFGPDLITVDRMVRTLMFRHRGQAYLDNKKIIEPETLQLLDSFLRGINNYIATGPLPVEYKLLRFSPRPFTRLDVVAVMGYMAYSFADGIIRDSLYSILEPFVTVDDLELLFPPYSLDNRTTIMEPAGDSPLNIEQKSGFSPEQDPVKRDYARFYSFIHHSLTRLQQLTPAFTGSNSWVLAPSRSVNGHALLANDPHIGIAQPGVWYEAHIKYPGYENYGYHLPLMPFPLLAHNATKGWAITMLTNDDLDLYRETFHPDNPLEVKFAGKWVGVKSIEETIKVKGGPDESLSIRITPHGPIFSDFITGYQGPPVSISWVYYKLDNPILDVVHQMAKASNIAEFEKAVSRLAAPGLNISYIDSSGNIGWWAAGRIPVRPPHMSGMKIHDGSSGKNEILGYLPFDHNPHLINPKSGLIITSNNLPTHAPLESGGVMTGYFKPSDRAARIYELLTAQEKWSLEGLKKIQTDTRLNEGMKFARKIVKLLDGDIDKFSGHEQRAFNHLSTWDGYMGVDSIGATIFELTIYHILKEVLLVHIGSENFRSYMNLVDYWNFLKRYLDEESLVITGTNPHHTAVTRETIVKRAFASAVTELVEKQGSNDKQWAWGKLHTIEYVHPLGRTKGLDLLFNIGPFPCPGEFPSVNKFASKAGDHQYKVSSLPSTRRLIDCNNPGESWSILPTGNSGNFLSPFYDNQAGMFLENQYRKTLFTTPQISQKVHYRFTLLPMSNYQEVPFPLYQTSTLNNIAAPVTGTTR